MDALAKVALYASIMEDDWERLDPAVKGAHLGERDLMRAAGVFCVQRGETILSTLVGRIIRLPPASDNTRTDLSVTRQGDGQSWVRSFGDGPPLKTLQVAGPPSSGTLEERFGPIWLSFELGEEAGALRYTQIGAHLGLGLLRVPLPSFLAPRVSGLERSCKKAGRTHIEVEVCAPLLGRLVRYEGWIEIEAQGRT